MSDKNKDMLIQRVAEHAHHKLNISYAMADDMVSQGLSREDAWISIAIHFACEVASLQAYSAYGSRICVDEVREFFLDNYAPKSKGGK